MTLSSVILLLVMASSCVTAQSRRTEPTGDRARGRYLVESVAQCTQCHTPRNEQGELIISRMLMGAPVPAKPTMRNIPWAEFAPRIAGLPQYTEEEMLTLLTRGVGREGKPLRAPMPTFRMSREDALEVIAYLKTAR